MTHTSRFLCALLLSLAAVAEAAVEAPTIKDIVEVEKGAAEALEEASPTTKGPADKFGRGTPRASVIGLAKALRDRDFKRAVNYLDLRNLPFTVGEAEGPELARKLLIIARRGMIIDYESLSDDPKGHLDDGLPSYRDRVTTVKTREGPVDILVQRVPRGDGVFIWKISNATIASIPTLDRELGYGPIGDRLSLIFPEYEVLGFEIWQWTVILLLLVAGYLFAFVTTWILYRLLPATRKGQYDKARRFIAGPLRFLILVLFFRSTFFLVAPSLEAQALFQARTLLILAVVWLLIGLTGLVFDRIAAHIRRQGRADAVVLLRPAATATKIVIIFVGVVSWLDNLGYEVTTLVAGLGVGGVAVAFAAQRSIENLLGSVMIYVSQPVRVGDLCRFGDTLGTVEEIGLRATQLRTPERTVVHIPNARFSTDIIENLTQRDRILYRCRLRLAFETRPEQLRAALDGIRDMIATSDYIDSESSRVRFLELGPYAQELELYVYIRTREFTEYLEKREQINLRVIDILEECGACLTVPVARNRIEGRLATTPATAS